MKAGIKADSDAGDINKSFDMDPETVFDIIVRINGLSFEGQRQIYAYLKTQIEKYGKLDEWNKLKQENP